MRELLLARIESMQAYKLKGPIHDDRVGSFPPPPWKG
jgi:hypothetical protein